MTTPGCCFYGFLPTLRLRLCGDPAALRHFDREYWPRRLATAPDRAEVSIRFASRSVRRVRSGPGNAGADGGHKSVRWTVGLSDPGALPLEATISLRGWPRSFGHSLVQGYFVEALLSLAAPAAGHVLLPAAAVVSDTGPVLILAPSGAGKSSLSARAIAAGRIVIGDDQVLLDRKAHCTAFPRRMRFYPDLAETAPAAYRALRGSTRTVLLVRGLIDRLTAGYVRPSLVVDPAEVNRGHQLRSGTIQRVLLLEPRAPVAELEVAPGDLPTLLSQARRLFELQRERLWAVAPADWRTAIEAIADMEEGILRSALEALPLERVQVPAGWPPKRSIDALTELVGIGPQAIGRAG